MFSKYKRNHFQKHFQEKKKPKYSTCYLRPSKDLQKVLSLMGGKFKASVIK